MSMRQFSELVGISNPYLSQIERGLREPSERVVESIATALRTTSDALYEQAGIDVDQPEAEGPSVPDAVKAESAAQRRPATGAARGLPGLRGGAAAAPPGRARVTDRRSVY